MKPSALFSRRYYSLSFNLYKSTATRCCADGKALPFFRIEIIDHTPLGVGQHIISDQQINLVHCDSLIFFIQLIQSQPQPGAASAKALKDHPQTFIRVLLHDLLELFTSRIGNYYHRYSSLTDMHSFIYIIPDI